MAGTSHRNQLATHRSWAPPEPRNRGSTGRCSEVRQCSRLPHARTPGTRLCELRYLSRRLTDDDCIENAYLAATAAPDQPMEATRKKRALKAAAPIRQVVAASTSEGVHSLCSVRCAGTVHVSTLRRWQYTERRPCRAGDEGGTEQEDVQHKEAGSPGNPDSHTFGRTRKHPEALTAFAIPCSGGGCTGNHS